MNSTLKQILSYIGNKGLLFISGISTVGSVILQLLFPIYLGRAIDALIGPGQVDLLAVGHQLSQLLWMVPLTGVFQWLLAYFNERIAISVSRRMRKEAFHHLQDVSIPRIEQAKGGEYISRLVSDVETFSEGFLMALTDLFSGGLTILLTIFFMLRMNATVSFVVIVMTPLSLLVARFIAKRTHSLFLDQARKRAKMTSYTEEMIGGEKTIHAFGREGQVAKGFDSLNGELQEASFKATFYASMTMPVTRFVNNITYALVALLGGWLTIQGALTVGSITALLSYARSYAKPFNDISSVMAELQNSLACAKRVFQVLELPKMVEEEREIGSLEGRMEMVDVDFSYVEGKPILKDMDVKVKAGERVALVGPTGCGKSTFINLLMRFYDPDSGCVLMDEKDIRNYSRDSLRENLGMVLQETWLFEGTIAENIRFGNPDITDEELIESAKKSQAHSFIKRMPEGYETRVRGNGENLSEGQKQLICIARLFTALPPIVLLDEATSSIDTRTEAKIQRALDDLMRGRTSFIVAHRLSTIMDADRILVMNDGRIVEEGTHEELLDKDGFYRQIYESQFHLPKELV